MCQVLIGVKYTRDWQLGLKKNLQDSVVKPIIFTTQKMKFSVKDLFKGVLRPILCIDINTLSDRKSKNYV